MNLASLLRDCVEPLPDMRHGALAPLLDRLSQARVVLLGGSTQGTSECFRLRSRITRALIEQAGFTTMTLASGAPEAEWLDRYVRGDDDPPAWPPPSSSFPDWVWRNQDMFEFLRWLREHNRQAGAEARVEVLGLDPFDLYDAIASVLERFDRGAPAAAWQARARFAGITPWVGDPSAYVEVALPDEMRRDGPEVIAELRDRLERRSGPRLRPIGSDGGDADGFFQQLYSGSTDAWRARERKMFESLKDLMGSRGGDARVVVWAHNADIGDASATSLGWRGEPTLGQLCRREFGESVHLVGFGVAHGTVTAAREWGGPPETTTLSPAHPESYEHLCRLARLPAFILPLRDPFHPEAREELRSPRLQRAIGAVYRPQTEMASHYFQSSLSDQFDEYVWFDRGTGVIPLP
jgi:protein-L-isoaspartate(D-aspartate) O-methyltransferase